MIKTIKLTVLMIVTFAFGAGKASAVEAPLFPSCSNPQGSLVVSYEDGIHGIVGSTQEYGGSDAVYRLDGERLLQCFCAVDGSGIQSDWWRVGSIDEEEIEILQKLGWNYIPSGLPWGLDEAAYMVRNSGYDCGKVEGSTTSNSSSGQVADASVGIGGSALGWASTGNIGAVYALAAGGILLVLSGKYLRGKRA